MVTHNKIEKMTMYTDELTMEDTLVVTDGRAFNTAANGLVVVPFVDVEFVELAAKLKKLKGPFDTLK